MLTLEVEFLTGVCFAAQSQSSAEPDWPPQPDRLFSALVAAWGARGEDETERQALEWLERQPVPRLDASEHDARRISTAYVPVNDKFALNRNRQPRLFPAAIPQRSVLRYHWTAEPETSTLAALDSVARDTAYLGHSASLVRCRFLLETARAGTQGARRKVYAGRMQELVREHTAQRRPAPGMFHEEEETGQSDGPASVFGRRWLVFEDVGGACPDIRAFSAAARALRATLMSEHYPVDPPEWLSGHQPGGAPANVPHMAIVPMADVGYSYSEGRLHGLALVLPRALEAAREQAERAWLEGVASDGAWKPLQDALGAEIKLTFGREGAWCIQHTRESAKKSLDARAYTRRARRWATATPIVLDRFPKAKTAEGQEDEVGEIIAGACENIGLPRPVVVRAGKHSALRGAPGSYPSGKSPAWMGWRVPDSLQGRLLTHAVLEFEDRVAGPVLLGSGRYYGLGLCRPIGEPRQ